MSTPSKTPVTDAAKYDSQPGNPMCPNGKMVVPAEVAENLERELIDFQKGMFSACSGYIGAREIAGKAIVVMENALKAGIAHSRKRMEESLPRLREELKQCRLDHQGPVHINSNVRLFDLVRFMRSELHQAELITDEEYSWLCAEAPMATAPEGGSPSPRRLEDYDELRAKLQRAEEGEKWAANIFCQILAAAISGMADAAVIANDVMGPLHSLECVKTLAEFTKNLRNECAEQAAQIVALRGEVESALKFLESRFGNEEGRDWGDAAAGDVADFLEEVLTTPPPAVAPLEDVRPLADAVAYTLSHHNEDGEGSIEKLQHTLSTFTAKHPL